MMFGEATVSSDGLVPWTAPSGRTWPGLLSWVRICRENALDVFPSEAYTQPRVDCQSFSRNLVLVNDPDTINLICGKRSHKYALTNLHLRMLVPSLGDGLIVAQGESWKHQRRLAATNAHPKNFIKMEQRLEDRINEFIDELPVGEEVDLLERLCMLSLDLIASSFFGFDTNIATKEALSLIGEHRHAIERVDWWDVFGAPVFLESGKMRRSKKITSRLNSLIEEGIENWLSENAAPDKSDVFSLRDFAVSILAGFESVAVTTNWALALSGQSAEFREKIRSDERASKLLQKVSEDTRRPFSHQFLLETLRYYPPLPLIYRSCLETDELPIGKVSKGSTVCMSPWLVHHNTGNWDHPDKFLPNRWANLDVPQEFMPFGVGARQCIGMNLGYDLCMRIIHKFVSRCDFQTSTDTCFEPRAGVSLRPLKPLLIKINNVK